MRESEYIDKLNKNTVLCHSIIVIVLLVSYVIEIIKGNRDIFSTVVFAVFCSTPLLIELALFLRKPDTKILRKVFVAGYSIFYTYNLMTANSVMNFVYILPMASVLIGYCDKALIMIIFGYALFLNIFVIVMQNVGFLDMIYMESFAQHLTSWEIQIACILLTGIFLYLSMRLILERNNVIKELTENIHKDPLTGCQNVRFYDESKEFIFTYDDCEDLSIAFIDIDDFKHFNTKYGHIFGDVVLKDIGKIILKNISGKDYTYGVRMGGDEFVVITKSMSYEAFLKMIENLKKDITTNKVKYKKAESSVNITIGIASKKLDKNCNDLEELYILADSRNQEAKDLGKNKIIGCKL